MPVTTGRYASRPVSSPAQQLAHRWFWLRHALGQLWPARLDDRDTRAGHVLHREWGVWTLRPASGWRARAVDHPPVHVTPRHP